MFGRRGHDQTLLQMQPGSKRAFAFPQAQDPRAPRHALASVGVIAAGPSIAEPDAVERALVVVHMVVPCKRSHHVSCLIERREEAGIEAGAADLLILHPPAGLL